MSTPDNVADASSDRPIRRALLLAPIIAAAAFFAAAITDLPLHTKGEAREAVVVQSMVRDGNYILPSRNGNEIPSKPPLFHWLAAIASHASGAVTPMSVRIPSVLAAVALIALTAWFAQLQWGVAAALAAATALATMQQLMASATTARVDMLLAAVITAAVIPAYRAVVAQRRIPLIVYFACAAAVLTKGPVGYVLPPAIVGAYAMAARRPIAVAQLRPAAAAAMLCLPALWYLAAWIQGGQAVLDTFFFRENFYRIVDPESVNAGHYRPLWFYLPALLGSTAPWCLLLIPALAEAWRRRRSLDERGLLFPLMWIAATIAVFSVSPSKRSVYLLPCFPAVALLVGNWMAERRAQPGEASLGRAGTYAIVSVAAFAAFLVALIAAQAAGTGVLASIEPLLGSDSDRANLAALTDIAQTQSTRMFAWAVAAFGLLAAAAATAIRRSWSAAFYCVAAMVAVTATIAGLPLQRGMAKLQSVRPFIESTVPAIANDEPLHFYRDVDYAATFYAGRAIPTAADASSVSARNRAWFFVWKRALPELCEEVAGRHSATESIDCRVEASFDFNDNPRRQPLLLVAAERHPRSEAMAHEH